MQPYFESISHVCTGDLNHSPVLTTKFPFIIIYIYGGIIPAPLFTTALFHLYPLLYRRRVEKWNRSVRGIRRLIIRWHPVAGGDGTVGRNRRSEYNHFVYTIQFKTPHEAVAMLCSVYHETIRGNAFATIPL